MLSCMASQTPPRKKLRVETQKRENSPKKAADPPSDARLEPPTSPLTDIDDLEREIQPVRRSEFLVLLS